MIELALAHFRKYAAFSKVTIQPSYDYHVIGSETLLTNALAAYDLPGNPSRVIQLIASESKHPTENNNAHAQWQQHNLTQKIVLIEPSTSGRFTPQMLDLEKHGAVSFNKGCYLGQEVVARTQHLGKLKRHLHQITLPPDNTLNVGDSLFTESQQEAGIIVARIHNQALAVIQDRFRDDYVTQDRS